MFRTACCGVLLLLASIVPVAGTSAATGDVRAVNTELTERARLGNISASLQNAAIGAGKTGGNSRSVAAGDVLSDREKKAVSAKEKSKGKRITIGSVLISMLVFVCLNLLSLSTNGRICTNCGYSGGMRGVILSKKAFLNSILVVLVRFLPIFLYYFAERGRFVCPRCGRTTANMTVKSRL
jgi:hypothetical protein